MTSTDLDAVLAQLWAGFAPLARSRVEVVATYAAGLTTGQDDPDLRADAATAAHKLAGALGSYGRDGSDEAAALELLLRGGGVPDARQVTACLDVLRSVTAT
jgi:hypothetical protein